MSTRITVALDTQSGGEIHAYRECFDPPGGPLYVNIGLQSDSGATTSTIIIPQREAIEWIKKLQKWAYKA